jgi:hypothetical protein
MTYTAEDFEDIEEVRAKLNEYSLLLEAMDGHKLRMTAERDELREILKYWEDCAEAAQRVTREHRP